MPPCREAGLGRGDLSEAEWRLLDAPLPPAWGRQSRSGFDNRQIVNGILWRIRTGAPWRDLPEKYGKWMMVYQRFRRGAGACPTLIRSCSRCSLTAVIKAGNPAAPWQPSCRKFQIETVKLSDQAKGFEVLSAHSRGRYLQTRAMRVRTSAGPSGRPMRPNRDRPGRCGPDPVIHPAA